MKFKKNLNGDWEAIGEIGEFLLWRCGNGYRIRYWTRDGHKNHTVQYGGRTLKEAKKKAMDDSRWE